MRTVEDISVRSNKQNSSNRFTLFFPFLPVAVFAGMLLFFLLWCRGLCLHSIGDGVIGDGVGGGVLVAVVRVVTVVGCLLLICFL